MRLPFFVKNHRNELLACSLHVEGTMDSHAWQQVVDAVQLLAVEFVPKGTTNGKEATPAAPKTEAL